MRRAALLRAHLHHTLVPPGRVHHHASLSDRQGERLLDVHVLAGLTRQDRRKCVPVIRRADDDGVDVGAIDHAPEIARDQIHILLEVLRETLACLRALLIVDVAERDALGPGAQRGAEVAHAHAAAADQP
jgi:hypothetical protein